ncbi:MAG TPA: phospholipase D family protein [Tepidisphaeraceae bacterium]|jgi:phosphatidylserine/phosphatidylglycerophosphate/cardiolipin synthase-like enzyme|nr:phospholipase D family protein [Tepidisphaeraceae bacterium]
MKQLAGLFAVTLLCGCVPGPPPAHAHRTPKPPAAIEDGIAVYFSPGGGALAAILDEIGHANQSIDVQAYLITAEEIVDALEAAQQRGVRVRIVLDKNNIGGIYSAAAYLAHTPLPVWRDGRHKDMHDKIMLIDGRTIIAGSFNFTNQSEDLNSENLLIIRDKPRLFAAYLAHFEEHLRHSSPPK